MLLPNNSIIDRPYDKEYDFRAEPSVLYKVSVLDLVRELFLKLLTQVNLYTVDL